MAIKMAKRLYEKLNEIKREIKCERLKEICRDKDTLNDALEIAKHESTITLSGSILITALSAVMFAVLFNLPNTVIKTDIVMKNLSVLLFLILYFGILVYLFNFQFKPWTNLYYDLIELRRMRREEPDISKLDIIISKIEAINPRMNVLEKNINTKMEAIKKEIMIIKRK